MRNTKVSKHITLNTLGVICKANGFTLEPSKSITGKYNITFKGRYVALFHPKRMKVYGSNLCVGTTFFDSYSLRNVNTALINYAKRALLMNH